MTAPKEETTNQNTAVTATATAPAAKLTSSLSNTPNTANGNPTKDQQIQDQKDRTLFCINIDEKCTEDILYELFLQAGPIDNIVRKADRNGNIIALVTYKHIESCEYAVKLFNGIHLFGQSLKCQPSQSSQLSSRSSSTNLGSLSSSSSNLNAQKNRQSIESSNNINANNFAANIGSIQPLLHQNSLIQLMSPLIQQMSPLLNQNLFNQPTPNTFNRSKSGSNVQDFENNEHRNRQRRYERQDSNGAYRHDSHGRSSSHHQPHNYQNQHSNQSHYQHQQYQQQQQQQQQHHHRRDHSNYGEYNTRDRKQNRSRSRSPINNRRR